MNKAPRTTHAPWRFSIVSPDRSADRTAATGGIRFGLENESARLHLATLMKLDSIDPEHSRSALMSFPGMTETTADALLDWLDEDSEPRQFGAEADDYLDRPNVLQPRDGLPTVLDELLLVRGVIRSQLLGPDENRNFVADRWEVNPQDALGAGGDLEGGAELEGLGWADLLTLTSAEQNVDSNGQPRIDLNQTSLDQLRTELAAEFPPNVVDFILLYRAHGPAGASQTSTSGADGPSGASEPAFTLESVADLIDATVVIADGSSSRTAQSPLTPSSGELLEALLDRTTADSRPVIPGRININLAPRPVLHAVPGLEDEIIERIVSRRGMLDDRQRRTPAWLLSEQLLTTEQFRLASPYITTGGDVFRAQLIAWRPEGGAYRRAEVICDGTSRPARRLVYCDLSAHGAAIPGAQLSSLQATRASTGR